MIVEGTYPLPGTPPVIWDLLMDPDVLAKAMPGTKQLVRTAPDRYEGIMRMGIGPITAAEFDLAITLTDIQLPQSYAMQIDGKGASVSRAGPPGGTRRGWSGRNGDALQRRPAGRREVAALGLLDSVSSC
jgi:hypothetical protein